MIKADSLPFKVPTRKSWRNYIISFAVADRLLALQLLRLAYSIVDHLRTNFAIPGVAHL